MHKSSSEGCQFYIKVFFNWFYFYVSGIDVWNPAFDITPAELITGGIVTEFGVFKPHELKDKLTAALNA